jgi:hypothetical protein
MQDRRDRRGVGDAAVHGAVGVRGVQRVGEVGACGLGSS